jgi:hypothetical protein
MLAVRRDIPSPFSGLKMGAVHMFETLPWALKMGTVCLFETPASTDESTRRPKAEHHCFRILYSISYVVPKPRRAMLSPTLPWNPKSHIDIGMFEWSDLWISVSIILHVRLQSLRKLHDPCEIYTVSSSQIYMEHTEPVDSRDKSSLKNLAPLVLYKYQDSQGCKKWQFFEYLQASHNIYYIQGTRFIVYLFESIWSAAISSSVLVCTIAGLFLALSHCTFNLYTWTKINFIFAEIKFCWQAHVTYIKSLWDFRFLWW